MDLNRINLNYYSFGYLGGFINNSIEKMSAEKLVKIAKKYNLGGVEFPVDYLYNNRYPLLDSFIKNNNNINMFFSLENFKAIEIKKIIPILKNNGFGSLRIKMSNHFGGNRFMVQNFNNEFEYFIKELESLKPYLKDFNFKLLIENHQDLNSHDILFVINKISPSLYWS